MTPGAILDAMAADGRVVHQVADLKLNYSCKKYLDRLHCVCSRMVQKNKLVKSRSASGVTYEACPVVQSGNRAL